MSPRSFLVILLAMSGSFVTILAVVGYIVAGQDPPRRVHARDVVTVAPPVLRSPAVSDGPRRRGPSTTDTPDVPAHSVPLSQTIDPQPESLSPPAGPDVDQMARVAEDRLEGVEAALARQVQAMKKTRDQMLDDFAGHLAAMSVPEAALSLKPLDDETAALTLKRLAPARRSAILRALPDERRDALQKRLGTPN